MKALWLTTLPALISTITGLLLHHRRARKSPLTNGQPIHAMSRVASGEFRIFAHMPELIELNREKVRAIIARSGIADPAKES